MVGVVDSNSKVNMRPVSLGERAGEMWQVTKGLKPGEKVVVKGIQKARPGSPVRVTEWSPPREQFASNDSAPRKEN